MDDNQKTETTEETKSQCPECLTETAEEELDMFGGYCEDCATDKLYE